MRQPANGARAVHMVSSVRSGLALLTIACCAALGAAASGCADSTPAPAPREPAAQQAARQAEEQREVLVERQVEAMRDAAVRGDRTATARAQQELERLARSAPAQQPGSPADDPFERMLEEFAFKRAPLFAQQITSAEGSRRLYVGVDRAAFCLLTPAARRTAVEGAYRPVDARLRADGIDDLQFVVVPLIQTRPTQAQALAIGENRAVRLTRRGRGC